MGKYRVTVRDHLLVPARALVTAGHEHVLQLLGRPAPSAVPVRLMIDTGSGRSTLLPSVLARLQPPVCGSARLETSLASGATSLFWVRLEFPDTPLGPLPEVAVASASVPPSLSAFHGVLGRDVLFRWEYFLLEGRRRRLTISDVPWRWLGWLLRW